MESLDLSHARPRNTRAQLAGVTFLPRSIDKFRATLPGGQLAGYSIDGFTGRMLERLGIAPDAFRARSPAPEATKMSRNTCSNTPHPAVSLDFLQDKEDNGLDDD